MPDHARQLHTVQLNIRTTPEEAREIREQARRRGMSLSRLIVAALRYVARLPYNAGFGRPDAADADAHRNT